MIETIPLVSAAEVAERSRLQQISGVAEALVTSFVKQVATLPVLDDMVLPDEYLQRIVPGLKALDSSYEVQTLAPRVGDGDTKYRFTVVKKGDYSRALLYFEEEILAEFRREYKLALEEVRDLFQGKYEVLYVFHAKLAPIYKNLMLDEWREKYRIVVKFIPLVDINGFANMNVDAQADYLRRELELGALPAAGASPRPAKLPGASIDSIAFGRLLRVIAEYPDFRDDGTRGRRVFVSSAGLVEFAEGFNFDGPARAIAGDLVLTLLKAGGLKKVLDVLTSADDVSASEKAFIADLLERYTFP